MSKRILVINDTQAILNLFRNILEEDGYDVILSSYPMQHVHEIDAVHPDLIILDLIFDGQKAGWQMLHMLKMYRPTAHIPVIVCTAALQAIREQEGYLVSQSVHVVYKPFDIDVLLTAIQQALSLRDTALHTRQQHNDPPPQQPNTSEVPRR